MGRWSHRSSRIRIRFRAPVLAGRELLVTIGYRGNPGTMRGPDGPAGWEELTDGVLVAAQPHGAPTWFPCNDRMADKAVYRIAVATDPAYRVVANGALVAERRAGRRVEWVYEQRRPMSTYLATLQIGRYGAERQEGGGVPSWLVGPPARMPQVRVAFADQPRMLEVFADSFGPYPFDRYTVVVADDPLEIPLESQTISTFGLNHLSRGWEAQRLIAHELAHQWFGNAVTAASLADIWLHEGFACYGEWLWSEASGRSTTDEEAERHHAVLAQRPQDLVLTDPGPHHTFDDRVYKRGALTLHALRRTVGDEVFFALLRSWVDENRYGVVTTADFEASVLDITGDAHAGPPPGVAPRGRPARPARRADGVDRAAQGRGLGTQSTTPRLTTTRGPTVHRPRTRRAPRAALPVERRTAALKRPSRESWTSMSSCDRTTAVNGYQALYVASLAVKSTVSQGVPGSALSRRSTSLCSGRDATTSSTPGGRAAAASASRPIDRMPARHPRRPATAAVHPAVCVMLPTKPGGHSGAPCSSWSSGRSRAPATWPSATRAHHRPVANSDRRAGSAPATSARSSPSSSRSSTWVSVAHNPIRHGVRRWSCLSSGLDLPAGSVPAVPGLGRLVDTEVGA